LDYGAERLWRDGREVHLRGKTFTVLRHLVEHPGELITKDELLTAVWPDTYVSVVVPMVCIRELRQALEDDAKAPRFIETVHRRGYRWIAPLTTTAPIQRGAWSVKREASPPVPIALRSPLSTLRLVGRETELAQLHQWLAKALSGERQIVFVTGEPGIGKTAVVEAFLQSLESRVQSRESEHGKNHEEEQKAKSKRQKLKMTDPRPLAPVLWIGRGQCIEHYGAGEAYLPVLEALGRLCRAPGGKSIVPLLRRHAPTWLVQIPAILAITERERLQREVSGATRERMLRELAEALEVLTAKQPLVLVLEDLQWSDVSTLDLLSTLARRRDAARLLVIGTYRPVEVLGNGHPLRAIEQELRLHRRCEELQLRLLTEADVGEYLTARFPVGATSRSALQRLARAIRQHTEGNPLFMVNVVDYLIAHGGIAEVDGRWKLTAATEAIQLGVPEDIRRMIERQLDRLGPTEQRILEAASAAGMEFSAATVAAAIETEAGQVESWCEALVRRQLFLQSHDTYSGPERRLATRYRFLHALYHNVLSEKFTPARRRQVHQRVGEWKEAAYGERAAEIAAELAVHFTQGRDYRRAVQYLEWAANTAIRRSAYVEAEAHLTKGLDLLKTLPDSPERSQQELTLQTALGTVLTATKGYAAPEVEKAYTRARELCRQMGDAMQLFPVLYGLWGFYAVRAELQTARELAEQLLRLARHGLDSTLMIGVHYTSGTTLVHLGELVTARARLNQGVGLFDSQEYSSTVLLFEADLGVACRCYAAMALWFLGYPDQALQRSREAVNLAQEIAHPYSLAMALTLAALVQQLWRERRIDRERAEALMELASEQGFPHVLAIGTILWGWGLAEQGQREEGIAQIRQGLATHRAIGSELSRSYYLALLAEAYGKAGRPEEGLMVLTEALTAVHKTEERVYEAELYRLKGELTLQLFKVQVQVPS
jgi:predicted ATPase/DNA-binding winged helix-turn-helix (wHTH) protein